MNAGLEEKNSNSIEKFSYSCYTKRKRKTYDNLINMTCENRISTHTI